MGGFSPTPPLPFPKKFAQTKKLFKIATSTPTSLILNDHFS